MPRKRKGPPTGSPFLRNDGGKGGIRTLDTFRYTPLAGERLRPLGHLSATGAHNTTSARKSKTYLEILWFPITSRVRLTPHPSHRTVHTGLVYGSCITYSRYTGTRTPVFNAPMSYNPNSSWNQRLGIAFVAAGLLALRHEFILIPLNHGLIPS